MWLASAFGGDLIELYDSGGSLSLIAVILASRDVASINILSSLLQLVSLYQ